MVRQHDQRYYNVRYYAAHRDSELERVKKRQAATLQWLRDLRRRPCADCGESFPPYVMDFDHRDPAKKLFAITTGSSYLRSRAKMIAEIEKCDIVCANCHALRTYASLMERRRRSTPEEWTSGKSMYLERKRAHWRASAAILNRLCDVPCADCGRRFPPCVMQFDHLDPTTKKLTISRSRARGHATLLAEVAKCDIVCTNCHRERTYKRRMAA
jgi:formate-dependent nitrite reductase cytochrome c552 subunit